MPSCHFTTTVLFLKGEFCHVKESFVTATKYKVNILTPGPSEPQCIRPVKVNWISKHSSPPRSSKNTAASNFPPLGCDSLVLLWNYGPETALPFTVKLPSGVCPPLFCSVSTWSLHAQEELFTPEQPHLCLALHWVSFTALPERMTLVCLIQACLFMMQRQLL